MANYKKLKTEDGLVYSLMSPQSLLESLRMAWLMYRHPDRLAALAITPQTWFEENTTPTPGNDPLGIQKNKKTTMQAKTVFATLALTAAIAGTLFGPIEAHAASKKPVAKQTSSATKTKAPIEVAKTGKKATSKKEANLKVAKAEKSTPKGKTIASGKAKAPDARNAAIASASIATVIGLHNVHDPLNLSTAAALLIDSDTHEVVYAKNPEAVLPIASITKLMTAMVVVESQPDMNEIITITRDDVDTEKNSSSRLAVGSQLSRAELMKLALMSSENRAAHALGRMHPGGLQKFVASMNSKARTLGMHQTNYVDPTGLSNLNRSTPMDLARLVKAASQHKTIEVLSTEIEDSFDVNGRNMAYHNTNALIRQGQWDIKLQKTGYIREAGRCMVMEVDTNGRKMVMVLLDSPTSNSRSNDAKKLRDYAMNQPVDYSTSASANRRVRAEYPGQL